MSVPTLEYLITSEQIELLFFVDSDGKIDSYRDLYNTDTRIKVFTAEWITAQEAIDHDLEVEYFPLKNTAEWNPVAAEKPEVPLYLYTCGNDEGMYSIDIHEKLNGLKYAFIFNEALDDEDIEEFFIELDSSSYEFKKATISDGDITSEVHVAVLEENI